jgi:crotonobetaine/carnitine-CoA ligase
VIAETIPDLFERSQTAEGRTWLRFEGDTWSLGEARAEVDRFAVGLAERGVVKGDVVAVLAGNRPETIFAWLAANRLGAIAAPLNPAYKEPELRGVLALTSPRVLVVSDELRSLALPAKEERRADLALASPADLAAAGAGAPRADVLPDDVAVLLATSGTTGAPKAVMQTHRTYALTAEAFPAWLGLGASDVLYCTLPLFHINAQAYSTMGSLGAGGVLALAPRFSASRFWDDVRHHGATEVNAVGAIVQILLGAPPSAADRDHGLRLVYTALALPEERHRAFEARFGVQMIVGYGLSETTFGTIWPLSTSASAPYGTMGALRQHPRLGEINRARVVTDDGADAATSEVGEMWLANPAIMKGYLGDPAETARVLVDGWFKTGDLVRCDAAGNYTFVARKKEVLRRRGENVAAGEIEAALAAHPSVLEAAVIGVPSPLGEDEIVAFVAPKPGHARTFDAEALRAFVKERLADYKVPSRVHAVDALPRTATERVAKHLLKEPVS